MISTAVPQGEYLTFCSSTRVDDGRAEFCLLGGLLWGRWGGKLVLVGTR